MHKPLALKRAIATIASFALAVSMCPASALADESSDYSVEYGGSFSWSVTKQNPVGAPTFYTDDSSVCTIVQTGVTQIQLGGWSTATYYATVTGVGVGTTTIRAYWDGSSASNTVTVTKATVAAPSAAEGLVYDGTEQVGVAGGSGYAVSGGSATAAGSYTATASLSDAANHQWADGTTADKTLKFSIGKASQSVKVATAAKSVKAKKVAKKAQTTSKVKVTGAKSTVTYTKKSGSAKLTIGKKTGKIKVKKGTKKGTYKIKVTVKVAKSSNYAAASKTVTIKVKVK